MFVDSQVATLIGQAEGFADELLRRYRPTLNELANELHRRGTLTGSEVDELLRRSLNLAHEIATHAGRWRVRVA
jgi:ATP-dependent Zn protease